MVNQLRNLVGYPCNNFVIWLVIPVKMDNQYPIQVSTPGNSLFFCLTIKFIVASEASDLILIGVDFIPNKRLFDKFFIVTVYVLTYIFIVASEASDLIVASEASDLNTQGFPSRAGSRGGGDFVRWT